MQNKWPKESDERKRPEVFVEIFFLGSGFAWYGPQHTELWEILLLRGYLIVIVITFAI